MGRPNRCVLEDDAAGTAGLSDPVPTTGEHPGGHRHDEPPFSSGSVTDFSTSGTASGEPADGVTAHGGTAG